MRLNEKAYRDFETLIQEVTVERARSGPSPMTEQFILAAGAVLGAAASLGLAQILKKTFPNQLGKVSLSMITAGGAGLASLGIVGVSMFGALSGSFRSLWSDNSTAQGSERLVEELEDARSDYLALQRLKDSNQELFYSEIEALFDRLVSA